MKKIIYFFVIVLCLSVFWFGCDKRKSDSDDLSLNETQITLKEGDQFSLVAQSKNESNDFVWSTSDKKIATVDAGLVTAKAIGEATITVKLQDQSATCHVKVVENTGEVAYKVEHYKQKADKFGYEVDATLTETLKAAKGTTVQATQKNIEGYKFKEGYSKNVLSAEVKDANTVLKVYYDIIRVKVVFKSEGNGDITRYFDYGSSLTMMPNVPSKLGYTGEWLTDGISFENIKEDIVVNARYTPKKYTLTLLFENREEVYSVDYGTFVTNPGDQVKPAEGEYEYDFIGWFKKDSDQKWNFDSNKITNNLTLETRFTKHKVNNVTIDLVANPIMINEQKFSSVGFTAEELAEMTANLVQNGTTTSVTISEKAAINLKMRAGAAQLKVNNGKEFVLDLTISDTADNHFVIEVEKAANAVNPVGKMGIYSSHTSGYTYTNGTLRLTGDPTYTFVDLKEEELTNKYYFETQVAFDSVNKFVGVLAACEYTDLSVGGKRLAFSFSGGKGVFECNTSALDTTFNTKAIMNYYLGKPESHKMAILRNVDDFYIIIDDTLVYKKTYTGFGNSGFGFYNASVGTCSFTDVKYCLDSVMVDKMLNHFLTTPQLGGAFTYPNGSSYNSFNGGNTVTAPGAGTLTGPSYIYNSTTVGNVYYLEAEFDKQKNWVGLLVNTLDAQPQINKGWLGYGVYDNKSLYLHTKKGNWTDGDFKCSVNVGSGSTYKMGVARVNDYYYVYINDVLVLQERVSAFKTSDNNVLLPADNPSAFGLFIGSNFKNTTTFKNFRFTMDFDEVAKYVGKSNVTFDNTKMDLTQAGLSIENGATVLAGIPVKVVLKKPEGKVLSEFKLMNGQKEEGFDVDTNISFVPAENGNYALTADFVDEVDTTLQLIVKSITIKVGGNEYAYYDILPTDVHYSLRSLTTGVAQEGSLSQLFSTFNLKNGMYVLKLTFESNTTTQYLYIDGAKTNTVDGYVSNAYLGGAITIPNESNVETTYYSYNNAKVEDTKGVNWTLVDGARDTVNMFGYTYAFQNQQAGTKYYVEGYFDANNEFAYSSEMGGLLVSHGPKNLADSSDVKLIAAIRGNSLVVASIPTGWNADDTRILANLSDFNIKNYNNVKLGVVRNGMDYYFFVDDQYVTQYHYELVKTVSGFGIAASPVKNLTIRNFNYSTNEVLVDGLISKAPATANKAMDIYFIAGQSNASGYSSYNETTAKAADPRFIYGFNNVYYAGNAQSSSGSTTVNRDLGWGLVRIGFGASRSKFGAEAGMAQKLSTYYNAASGKEAGFIKFAHGGTALLDNIGGENACEGNWVPPSYQATITPQSATLTGGLYRGFLAQVKRNVAELKAMGYTELNYKGLFWMQGESDKNNPNEYKKAFAFFVSDIRRDLGALLETDLSNLAIIVGEISRSSGSAEPSTVTKNENFIKMQNELVSIPNVYIVKSGKYDINKLVNGSNSAVGTDSWHWNQKDMIEIGNLVGECILKKILK